MCTTIYTSVSQILKYLKFLDLFKLEITQFDFTFGYCEIF